MIRSHIAAAMFELPVAIDKDVPGAIAAPASAAHHILLQFFGVVIQGAPQFHQETVVEMKAKFAQKRVDDLQSDLTDIIGHHHHCITGWMYVEDAFDIAQDKRRRQRLIGVRMGAPKPDLAAFDRVIANGTHDLMLVIP